MKLPNFLIVGVPKAGTTSVYFWLKQHPEIYMSPVKEPQYFSQIRGDKHIKKWDEYIELFKHAKNEKAIGEASTSYFHFWERSIPLIKEKLENPKIIIILRNPIERAWSHFQYYIKLGRDNIDNMENFFDNSHKVDDPWGICNPYIYFSFYYKPLKEYLRNFKNTKVLLYEDLKENPEKFIKELFEFLEVDRYFTPYFEVRNVSGKPRNKLVGKILENNLVQSIIPKVPYSLKVPLRKILLKKEELPKDVRAKLLDVFYEDIKQTEKILEKDLSIWLK